MIAEIRRGAARHRLETALAALGRLFAEAGYEAVETRHLFPADILLDLYGEDLRTRAFLFPDAGLGGEVCLRPDFTVPVVLAHAEGGWDRRAAYAYGGPVFRRQDPGSTRPIEYLQAGIESFGEPDAPTADARVLTLVLRGLEALGVHRPRIATGDLGIVFAALDRLEMPEPRRRRLRRHIWRPARFHTLIRGFLAPPPAPGPRRAALLAASASGPAAIEALALDEGDAVGARTIGEIAERAAALARAANEPPMPSEQGALIEALLSVEGPAGEALSELRALMQGAGLDIGPALDRFEARLDALNRVGLDAEELSFSAAFGRSLEYYSGFVFEITAEGMPDLPPLAGGGRYDAMTRRLGAERAVPAVGAMIRPEAALAAEGAPS